MFAQPSEINHGSVLELSDGRWIAVVADNTPNLQWHIARAKAQELTYKGIVGDLARIDSPSIQSLVRSRIAELGLFEAWIGLRTLQQYQFQTGITTDQWKWEDGTVVSWTAWNAGEPDCCTKWEGVAMYGSNGRWNDEGAYAQVHGYVVQFAPLPPVITAQPKSVVANLGDQVQFSVGATNGLSYQWTKDGTRLPGETNAALRLRNVQPYHVGDYRVEVSGVNRSATSLPASLNINGINATIWRGIVAWYPFDGDANNKVNGSVTQIDSQNANWGKDRFNRLGTTLALGSENPRALSDVNSVFEELTVSGWMRLNDDYNLQYVGVGRQLGVPFQVGRYSPKVEPAQLMIRWRMWEVASDGNRLRIENEAYGYTSQSNTNTWRALDSDVDGFGSAFVLQNNSKVSWF